MAATKLPTKCLEGVARIAAAQVSIGAGRVKIGYANYADGYNWEDAIRGLAAQTQGFFSCWLKACTGMGELENGIVQIAGELAVYCPKDTSSDLIAAWELALALAEALYTQSNYIDGEVKASSVSVSLHKLLTDGGPGIAVFDFGAYGNGKIEFLDP